MRYRELGKTGLKVSEIGLGAEWLERHNEEEVRAVIDCCESAGINILDCWMAEPNVRTNIGKAIAGKRERWIIQGHFGSTWQNGQYVRTREMSKVKPAFEDLLARLETDYIDLGMIHFVDEEAEFHRIMEGEFLAYVKEQKAKGVIRHIGERVDLLGGVGLTRCAVEHGDELRAGQLAVRLGQVLVGGRADGPVAQLHGAQPPRLPQKSFHGVCLLCSLLRALRGRLCAENCITARPHGQEILLTASGFSSILEET